MKTLRLIFTDQLSKTISALQGADKQQDLIVMHELVEQMTHVKHHKKKIAFLLSAMRHFAAELEEDGYNVRYIKLDEPNNSGNSKQEIKKIIDQYNIKRIVVTKPSEYNVLQDLKKWEQGLKIQLEIKEDDRFLCGVEEFADWAKDRAKLRMEYFYRQLRVKYNILMDGQAPEGGKWNYDAENRKPPKEGLDIPKPYYSETDAITKEVIELVSKHFADHFGDLEPFHFAVTRDQALDALDLFVKERLPNFGEYQDAMIQNEPWMYHSHLSFYINCGLLLPLECARSAEFAYNKGDAPLNAAEGFIRQIIGWREYVRGIYWLKMPGYVSENFFNAQKDLPEFYWSGKTKMNCIASCVKETKKNAYAHHIQRLMVLGNFALITGIKPADVNEWFWIVYADAFEWVELPNVSGMILFADGGYLASKPYAAGGSYINKMSNYCKGCFYSVKEKNGPAACPFNYLYWDFLIRNQDKLESNHRVGMMYKTLSRMDVKKIEAIKEDSRKFLDSI